MESPSMKQRRGSIEDKIERAFRSLSVENWRKVIQGKERW